MERDDVGYVLHILDNFRFEMSNFFCTDTLELPWLSSQLYRP